MTGDNVAATVTPKRAVRRAGAGRPTRAQALQRQEELLDNALEIFLDKGYELATIDAIAASVRMTKRTVYARYPDKAALFRAAVQRAVDRWVIPVDELRAAETDDLETTLTAIARIRLDNATSPAGLRLQRILNAESYRFPDVHRLMYEQGTLPAIDFLADLLGRHAEAGAIDVHDSRLLGESFLSLVVGGLAMGAVWGAVFDEAEIEHRISFCVRLFLNGLRPR
jgi:AcrR family transcriptional regulator